MVDLIIRHKVQDYAKWKPIFDEHAAKRKAGGSKGGRLFRSEKDPNEVVILFEWEDSGKAHKFIESEDLRRTMDRAGVVGKPDVYFLDEKEKLNN
jgi:heme-degrading monooxygenase HmoA